MGIIQDITYFLTILSFILYVDLYKNLTHKRLFFIPIILYLFHILTFYSLRIITTYTDLFPNYISYFSFTNWSAAIRLQAGLTIFFFAFIMGKYDRKIITYIKNKFNRG